MATKTFIVAASDESLGDMSALASRLEEAGLTVSQRLDAVGVLIGTADDAAVPRLRQVAGVLTVDEERTVEPWERDEPT